MIWVILAIFFFLFAGVEFYLVFNLNRKLSICENWIVQFSETVKVVNEELHRIDDEATFRSDDEIGYFYQAMYSILTRLSEIGIIDEEEITGEIEDGEKQDLLYERDRERNRRIQRVRRSDVSLADIQKQNRKATQQVSRKHNKPV